MYKRLIKHIAYIIIILTGSVLFTKVLNSMDKVYYIISLSLIYYLFHTLVKNSIIKKIISVSILLIIFIQLIIIPYSFYLAWLEHIQNSIPESRISQILTYLVVYIWVFFISVIADNGKKSNLIKLISVLSIISTLIYNNIYLYILFLLSLVSIVIINVFRSKNYEKLIPVLLLMTVVTAISYKTHKNDSIDRSDIVESLSYNLRKFLVSKFPDINLLSTIPGMSDNFRNNRGKPPVLTNNHLFKIKGNPGETYYLRMSVGYKNNEHHLLEKKDKTIQTTRKIKLTVLSDFLPVLPTTIDTTSTNIFDLPTSSDYTYKFGTPLPRNSEFFLIKDKNSGVLDLVDDLVLESNIELEQMAQKLKSDSDKKTAENIRNYLVKNYTYSLNTSSSDNYISQFLLSTKTGFCVHFTRAFILMARINGLRCREISGYTVYIPRRPENNNLEYGEEIITGKNAHLWPEIYLEGEWKTFEVTPPYIQEKNELVQDLILPSVNTNKVIKKEEKRLSIGILLSVIPTILILTITFIIFNNNEIISKLIRLSVKKGVPHPSKIGWKEWNRIFLNNDNYINKIIEMNYSNSIISKVDKKELRSIYKKLRKEFNYST